MRRLRAVFARPAATTALFVVALAVFNWPLVGVPLAQGPVARYLALFGLWATIVLLIALHAACAPRSSRPNPDEEPDA